jgi:hypothetical protein
MAARQVTAQATSDQPTLCDDAAVWLLLTSAWRAATKKQAQQTRNI